MNQKYKYFFIRIKMVIRFYFGILSWMMSSHIKSSDGSSEVKRLLLIYDFSSQPLSVGDILILQEAALVQREKSGVDKIDIALVFDSKSPLVDDPAFSHILPENFFTHLTAVLPAAQANPHLGSIFLFDSHQHLEKYVADNYIRYVVWPDLFTYASKQYLLYYCFKNIFVPFYDENGWLPKLSARPAIRDWAINFLKNNSLNEISVSVQMRKNLLTPLRNSDYSSWYHFFEHCLKQYKVKFFIICSQYEVEPCLRELSNVVIVKDHFTTLEQDLALIENCDFHIGPSSGPGTIALFNDKPYCMFSSDMNLGLISSAIESDGRCSFSFSSPNQVWLRESDTFERICDEFEILLSTIKN